MNILFLGSFFEKSRADEIWRNSKGPLVISADTFQQSLLDGFCQLNRASCISLLTIPAVGSYPFRYKKIWFKRSVFQYGSNVSICGGFLNFTLIKKLSIYISAKKNLNRWAKMSAGKGTIIVYALLPSYLKAAIKVKKQYPQIKISCIVLDLPEYFGDRTDLLSRVFSKYEQREIRSCLPKIDSYILLTRQMSNALGILDKPYIILEGLYSLPVSDSSLAQTIPSDNCRKILYSGQLDNRFGISNLLEAFKGILDENYRLWICGDGSAKKQVLASVAEDNRIVYFGWLERGKILQLQKTATVLINPRSGDGEYTKYSFPSKTMEYMASGTPTLMYPLPGVPDEYLDNLVIIKGSSVENMRNTIVEWCEKPHYELKLFGEKAKEFILKNKNAKKQAERVLDFINDYY